MFLSLSNGIWAAGVHCPGHEVLLYWTAVPSVWQASVHGVVDLPQIVWTMGPGPHGLCTSLDVKCVTSHMTVLSCLSYATYRDTV